LSLATWCSDETTTPFFESERWNSWREYRQDLSAAITRLDERGFRTNDYDYVADFLRAQTKGEPTTGLAGRLQCSDSGEGLAGCELVASWNAGESEYRDYATTDENGFYVFNFLPSNVPITLSAASGAYDLSESSITLDGQDVLRKRLTAKPFGSIAGRVVDENGRIVQNAEITLTNEAGETWNAISDRAGVYSFAALKSGTYLVSLNTTGKFKPSTPTEASVKNGIATTGLNLTAERGAEVSGKICDSEGLPLADAAILVVDASGARVCALTDAEGRFAVGGFDEGEATITISAGNCVSVVETVALTAQKTTKINKSLQSASLISGFVRNNDGTPAADATFILTDENENGYWVNVDESGFYCVDFLPPGDYRLEISVGGTICLSQKLTIAEGSDGETIDFVLSATTRLTGTATYADGQPLAGVILTLSDENGRRYATVAEDGTYAFENLAPGVYELAVSNVEQTWTVSWNGEESAPTQNVELDFIGRVSGVLTLANGEAAATAQVYLFKDGELVDSVFANGEGRLDVYLREPGFYTFRAVHENGFFSAWEANVERGSDLTFEATAGTASAQANATGLSTDDETQTVYWNLLSVDDEGRATAELTGYSDDGAALNFVGLTPGKYRVLAYCGTKVAKSEFEISEGATATTFDLAFSEKAILTATVQLPTGFEADRADAIGWLYDAENNLVNSAAIDDEGNLLYYFLEPGEYALVVVAGRTVGTAKLTIPANETAVSQNVELTEATVTISGSITLDGAPIGDQGVVLIKNGDGVVVGIGYSDADGNFVAYALEAESYQLVCVDYATTATATVELTGEKLTGVAIRLAVVPDVCAALTTAAPTETESATEQTAPIISNATAEEDPGYFWQKLDRQKMYYDEILLEFRKYEKYQTSREDCCYYCGKGYDLYLRTLDAALADHDRAKTSLDVLEKLKKEIEKNCWELGGSFGKLALLFIPGGPIIQAIEIVADIAFVVKDAWNFCSSFQESEVNKLLMEIASSFEPYTSKLADRLLNVLNILTTSTKYALIGDLDKAREEYSRTVGQIRNFGQTMKKLKEDFELAWKNLDKLTDPSSPSKVPVGYADFAVDQAKKAY
ncbi:MAG: carboxypeptidase regulatory-like domain-containing protein, partial [Thermoguttaceae bacterium]|nr:carboxypeptidase regulatory-like domain-containing protein [Thermoguttaceae bacterium]